MLTYRDHNTASRAFPVEQKPDRTDVPDTYPAGRRCLEPGCITILCQFNPGPWCYCHAARHTVELAKAAIDADIHPVGERPEWAPHLCTPVTL